MSFARLTVTALSQRLAHRLETRLARPLCRSAAVAAALVVAACGGNATRVEPFVPTSLVAFGDENSLVSTSVPGATAPGNGTANGWTYSVNYFDTALNRVDCTKSPVWAHYVAINFGLVFAECNPTGVARPTAFMQAAYGDRVANVATKVAAYKASPGFTPKTLVTVMAGMWDIQDAVAAVKAGKNRIQAIADIEVVGRQLGDAVNSIADGGKGGKVLYVMLPWAGLGPCSSVLNPGNGITTCAEQAALLNELTQKFNTAFDLRVANQGFDFGIVKADVKINQMSVVENAPVFGLTNTTAAACVSAPPPGCTSANALPASFVNNIYTYLWADELHLTPAGHAQIGADAVTVARNNPF